MRLSASSRLALTSLSSNSFSLGAVCRLTASTIVLIERYAKYPIDPTASRIRIITLSMPDSNVNFDFIQHSYYPGIGELNSALPRNFKHGFITFNKRIFIFVYKCDLVIINKIEQTANILALRHDHHLALF